jgi:hypothetical protein
VWKALLQSLSWRESGHFHIQRNSLEFTSGSELFDLFYRLLCNIHEFFCHFFATEESKEGKTKSLSEARKKYSWDMNQGSHEGLCES